MTTPSPAELGAHPFLNGLMRSKVALIAEHAHNTILLEGDRIFEEGSVANRFWLLWKGQITLDIHLPGKGTLAIETLGDGDVLGWSWLFPPYRWRFGAVADRDTESVEVDGPMMRALCQADAVLGREMYLRFAEIAVERLQATRMRFLDLYGSQW